MPNQGELWVWVDLPRGHVGQAAGDDPCQTIHFLLDVLAASNVHPSETTWTVGPWRHA